METIPSIDNRHGDAIAHNRGNKSHQVLPKNVRPLLTTQWMRVCGMCDQGQYDLPLLAMGMFFSHRRCENRRCLLGDRRMVI